MTRSAAKAPSVSQKALPADVRNTRRRIIKRATGSTMPPMVKPG
jgi:hypothetical protein